MVILRSYEWGYGFAMRCPAGTTHPTSELNAIFTSELNAILGCESMDTGIGPILGAIAKSMPDRVHMNIITTPLKIRFISNPMFPKPSLPEIPLISVPTRTAAGIGWIDVIATIFRHMPFNQTPPNSII
jgi:hypothetical protein